MLSRYFALLLIAFLHIKYNLIYSIFTPLTVIPVFEVLNKLYFVQFIESFYSCPEIGAPVIFIKGYYACIVNACVAGAAYFFLIALNLATPMHPLKRIKSLIFLIASFLIINIIRIIIFIILVTAGYKYFDVVHEFTWIIVSTLIVVCVWFANVKIFNINTIPGWTDINAILQDVRKKMN